MHKPNQYRFYCAFAFAYLLQISLFAVPSHGLTLQEAFHISLESNPTYAAKLQELHQAEAEIGIHRGALLPQLDALGTLVLTDRRNFDQGPTIRTDPRAAGLRLQQDIFKGGENIAELRLAQRLKTAADADLVQIEQDVMLTSAEAYLDVLLAQRILELNTFQVKVLAKQLQATESRFELGEVTKTDVAQAKARTAAAKATQVAARGQLVSERAIFEEIIGVQPEALEWPQVAQKIPDTFDGLLQKAYAVHPQVAKAVAMLAAEKQAVLKARSGYWPDVTAEVGLTRREGGFSTLGNGDSDEFNAVLNATFPLFKGGTTLNTVRQAKARREQLDALYTQARREVARELTDAFHTHHAARAELISRHEATTANELAYEGVKQETLLGVRTTLDLLDAEEELLQARVDEVTAKHQKTLSTFKLMAALGELRQGFIGRLLAESNTTHP